MARVLPVPAPASTQTAPRVARATSRCSGSSAASSVSEVSSTASVTHPPPLPLPHPAASGPRAGLQGTQPAPLVLHDSVIFPPTTRRQRVAGQLTMYTTPWCGFCRNLKNQLARAGIEMVEVDIERDEAAAAFVMSVNGGNQTVPTVMFPDGTVLTNPSAAQVKAQLAASAG